MKTDPLEHDGSPVFDGGAEVQPATSVRERRWPAVLCGKMPGVPLGIARAALQAVGCQGPAVMMRWARRWARTCSARASGPRSM